MKTWLLLIYKVPPTPTANRVYVWRKVKQLGALLLHDAVWTLPANDRTREQLQWLVAEISDLQGDAWLWEGQVNNATQDQQLVQQFTGQIDAEYAALLTELQNPTADGSALARRYQQVKRREHFPSDLGEQVRSQLLALRRAGLDEEGER